MAGIWLFLIENCHLGDLQRPLEPLEATMIEAIWIHGLFNGSLHLSHNCPIIPWYFPFLEPRTLLKSSQPVI